MANAVEIRDLHFSFGDLEVLRGLSLNIRHPEGLEIARRLVSICDVVAEGFSPGVLGRLGLGYEGMKARG